MTLGSNTFPLSYNQSSLWYFQQVAPATSVYNVHLTARIRGRLDVGALAAAVEAMVARHGSLRTTFHCEAGPVQRVHDGMEIPLAVSDAGGWDEPALRDAVEEEYQRPYALDRGPCFRPHLWRVTVDEHVLMLGAHHLVMDGMFATLHDELWATYAAAVAGEGVALPAPSAGYDDFVRWQAAFLASEAGERQRRWWADRLGTEPPVLELPTDRPRPPVQSFRGGSIPFVIDAGTTARAVALAREEHSTMFRLLFAAFAVLLHRYSGQTDIIVGSPASGRTDPRFAALVGLCVNMLPIRSDLSGNPTFRSLLRQVDDTARGAIRNQDFPFPLMVEQLQSARDASRPPLCQAAFSFLRSETAPQLPSFFITAPGQGGIARPGLRLEPFGISQQDGQFDLALWMARPADELIGELKYASELFDAPTIARAGGHFTTLLQSILADPDGRVGELPMLTDEERRQIVVDWNRTEHRFDEDRCVHELFEAQADRQPGAVAATVADRSVTYADVEADANRLAHLLRRLGAGPGRLVGVYLDRSADIPSALVGILKSGAGYVPLDTSHPPARLETILSSLSVSTIVTHGRHVGTLQALDIPDLANLIVVDTATGNPAAGPRTVWGAEELQAQDAARPAAAAKPTDTAYVIFTSGSTGAPKGVEVTHRPAVNVIQWVNETFSVGAADRLLMVTSLGFDLSVYDVLGTLAAGASLHVASADDLRDPTRLVRLLLEEPITVWNSAPPALQQLVPFLPAGPLRSPLRLVLLSGDWMPVTLPDQLRAVFPAAEVVNLGGATEATIWSNVYRIGAIDPTWVSVPYGKPIWNARYYVLDPHGAPCPIGIPGDLFIGGQCLAAGYVNAPELTESRFVPDPVVGLPGARMYRTGDRARFLPDGNLQLLGREDSQVKVRGYRIEPGEIEAVLRSHAAVTDAVVLARDDGPDRHLVAYVVPAAGADLPASELKARLRDRLPAYMVPAHLVALDRLPLTPNGKLDRRALPAPDHVRDVAASYVAPRTELEGAIARIWAEVLGVDRVGVEDNFLELGGHSLLAVEMVVAVEELVGRRLPSSIFFRASTVSELAAALEVHGGEPDLVVVLREGVGSPVVLFHPAGGDLLVYRHLVGLLGDQPVLGVRSGVLAGHHEEELPSIDAMAGAYAAALVERGAPRWRLAGWSMGGVLAHAVAARLELAGEEVEQVILLDAILLGEDGADHPALRHRIAAGAPLDDTVLARQGRLIEQHERLLSAHRAPVVGAPLSVWWAAGSCLHGRPPTDWTKTTSGPVDVTVVESHHYTILRPPAVSAVAAGLAPTGAERHQPAQT